jgi:hypothetical protein
VPKGQDPQSKPESGVHNHQATDKSSRDYFSYQHQSEILTEMEPTYSLSILAAPTASAAAAGQGAGGIHPQLQRHRWRLGSRGSSGWMRRTWNSSAHMLLLLLALVIFGSGRFLQWRGGNSDGDGEGDGKGAGRIR